MEDMDIDSIVDIPDTPDRLSSHQVNGGNFIDKESNLSVAGRVGGSSTTGEESLDRQRGRGRLLPTNGHNRKHYVNPLKLSGSTDEIERPKNTIFLSPPECTRENAPLFRKTATARSRNCLREQEKDKGKAHCSKLPSKSSGFQEDHTFLDLDEQRMHNQIPEMEFLQSASENCLTEGRKEGQVPRNGGSYVSRTRCKGKEKVEVELRSIDSVMSNGKGVDLSHGSPHRVEKQFPASHHSVVSPRAVGKRRLVRNGCISPHNIAIRAKQNEQSQSNFRSGQNFDNVVSSSPCMLSEIVTEDNNSGKGKRVAHPHTPKEHDINFINLSSSPMSNNGEASGFGDVNRDACFEEKGGWRNNFSKNVDDATGHHLHRFNNVGCQVSQQNDNGVVKRNNASRGKTVILCDSPEIVYATETAPVISKVDQISESSHANMLPKRQMKHGLTSRNNGESSRVTRNGSDIVFLGSSRESSNSRSSSFHIAEHLDVLDLDNSPEMRGINANNTDSVNDEDAEAKARQLEADEKLARELQEQLYHEIDENIAWTLQQEEDALHPTFRTLHEPDHRVSTRQSRMQPPLRNFQNSSNRRGVQTHFPTSARVSRLRNRILNQPRMAPSRTRNFQFPLDMDLDMRLDILEAMEAAIGDSDDMGMASHIFQIQRDFNENDYEMLLALDDNNHQHGGASINQINSLPLSKVQTDNFEEACAICLETPAIGETIRHLPCLHKFHKNCIDPWLSRKTSCPVCKSSIT
ncbi:hypothetical protein ES319_D02G036600v1 [Gossypium barbadense]|uniref:RING-type domain-containing protein n=2 Tax=Gossypium TaxID=3633 RepID=A0A5J5S847_GOSBA|nr:hypothetical protein ES319_D02G036600v1 [Gossypium barbadense]KAB2039814.1 hypothetical protein ES319_D02G036600v1 [Gossypium barbadense]TYG78201.1 hypothetical protein ES288_D02G039400v1 [Gossypium darwinii]